jgi:acetate---CoA ligase (ADP-forming)
MTSTAAQPQPATDQAHQGDQTDQPRQGDLTALFAPRRIAVVGASRSPGKLGAVMARSLRGFATGSRTLALVNGRDEEMYGSVGAAAADGAIDLAVICVPAPACPGVLAEAAAAGAGAAVICGGGFGETGGQGVVLQRELSAIVAGTGIRLLGPNTSGFIVPPARLAASFVPGAAAVRPGRVAVVAASGGINHALAFGLAEAGHGVSLAVGLGNAADVTAADILDYLADDPATGAVALHVESVRDGRRLARSVRHLTQRVPVVALVAGQHDVGAFAASHTGALATSWRTTRAALAQAGAVLAADERELIAAVAALSVTRARPGGTPGVGVVTAQAGPGLLLLDDLRGRRVSVPELTASTQRVIGGLLPPLTFQRNPVDTGRPGPELAQVLAAVAADPGVDIVAGYALHEPEAVDLAAAVRDGRAPDVPVVFGVAGIGDEAAATRRALSTAGVAVATDPTGVAAAVAALAADARARHRRLQPGSDSGGPGLEPCNRSGSPSTSADADGGGPGTPAVGVGPFDEHAAKSVLGRLGIATMPRRACDNRAAAHAALAELGGPVAVKLLDAAVLHKTEIGGVRLGIRTPSELDAALDALDAAGARRFLVEAMAPDGIDLVAGARRDPVFGPVVLAGLGGILAEAIADVAVRMAPLPAAEAATMPAELTARALLDGWRGGPVLDTASFGRVLAGLGDLLAANPRLDEVEINPLRLTADGLVALDAVIITREATDAQPDQPAHHSLA